MRHTPDTPAPSKSLVLSGRRAPPCTKAGFLQVLTPDEPRSRCMLPGNPIVSRKQLHLLSPLPPLLRTDPELMSKKKMFRTKLFPVAEVLQKKKDQKTGNRSKTKELRKFNSLHWISCSQFKIKFKVLK